MTLWVLVYVGNFIGSVVWAYLMANGPFVSFDAAGAATATAFGTRAIGIMGAKTAYVGTMGFYSAFLKGIGCNWLVNLAILLGICADDLIGKFFGIWFPIMAFVSSGLEHSIANMYFHSRRSYDRSFDKHPNKGDLGQHVDVKPDSSYPWKYRRRFVLRRCHLLGCVPQRDRSTEVD